MFPALDRVFEAAECKTQVELAELFEIRQSSISDAKRRKSIPAEWLIKLLRLKGINPDWILAGEGEKYLAPANSGTIAPHVAYLIERRPPEECPSQELVNELVRRALKSPELEALQKQVAESWLQVKKSEE